MKCIQRLKNKRAVKPWTDQESLKCMLQSERHQTGKDTDCINQLYDLVEKAKL